MDVTIGAVLEGKVTGIMKFGAFVSLPGGKSGLVHISEIAYTYVNQVSDHLQVGQEVKVKVIGIDEAGRINLSIKKAMDPPQQQDRRRSAPPPAPRAGDRRSTPPRDRFRPGSAHRRRSGGLYGGADLPVCRGRRQRPSGPGDPMEVLSAKRGNITGRNC